MKRLSKIILMIEQNKITEIVMAADHVEEPKYHLFYFGHSFLT